MTDLVGSSIGADVIDYVDRDSLFCGLDHKIDSAIYRSFVLVDSRTTKGNRRILKSKLVGRHGFRIDRDFAIGSLLRERLALFMKVYAHPIKISSGAMIGKALFDAIDQDGAKFSESCVELMGDEELITALGRSESRTAQRISKMLTDRSIYHPAFRARVLMERLEPSDYFSAQSELTEKGLTNPRGRLAFEKLLAHETGVDESDIIFYCSPKAPGAKSVNERDRVGEGVAPSRRDPLRDHHDVFRRHLELWNYYLFVHPSVPSEKRQLLARLMQDEFHRTNEVDGSYRQLGLDI